MNYENEVEIPSVSLNLPTINFLAQHSHLTALTIPHAISDLAAKLLLQSSTLTSLNLKNCKKISQDTAKQLFYQISTLRTLTLCKPSYQKSGSYRFRWSKDRKETLTELELQSKEYNGISHGVQLFWCKRLVSLSAHTNLDTNHILLQTTLKKLVIHTQRLQDIEIFKFLIACKKLPLLLWLELLSNRRSDLEIDLTLQSLTQLTTHHSLTRLNFDQRKLPEYAVEELTNDSTIVWIEFNSRPTEHLSATLREKLTKQKSTILRHQRCLPFVLYLLFKSYQWRKMPRELKELIKTQVLQGATTRVARLDYEIEDLWDKIERRVHMKTLTNTLAKSMVVTTEKSIPRLLPAQIDILD